jgi:hypothetical protein
MKSFRDYLNEAAPAVTPGAVPPPTAGQPAASPAATAAAPKVQVPKVPPMPQPPQGVEGEPRQNGGTGYDLGQGSMLVVNPDGTRTYTGSFGTFTYDKAGKAVKYNSPTVGGLAGEVNLAAGGQTTSYNAGDVAVSGTANAAGKVTGTSAAYTMGDKTATQTTGAVQQENLDSILYLAGMKK